MKIINKIYPKVNILSLHKIIQLGVDGFVNGNGLHVVCGEYIIRLPSGRGYGCKDTQFPVDRFVDIEINLTERPR